MKKLLFAMCFVGGAVFSANAQQTDEQDQASAREEVEQTDTYRDKEDENVDREKISQAELPALVSEQLASTDYSGWTVSETYKKEKDGETFYKVEMTNGSEKKWVKFDAQGNKIKEMDEEEKKEKHEKY